MAGIMDSKISRRIFLTGSATAASGLAALWGSWPWLPGMFHRRGTYVYPMRTELWKGVEVRYSVCRQCRSDCGLEARVFNGVLIKLDGNPYHPNTTEPQLSYATTVNASLKTTQIHSLCARGQAGRQTLYDRFRTYYPLKRVGPRGSGQWKTISWEQLIAEVTEGGYLFKDVPGEASRHVDGFAALWRHGQGPNTPVDPAHPDLGPVTNQFVLYWGRAEPGQSTFLTRFATAFGSVNALPHVGICELNHHVATMQSLDGKIAMLKPDIKHAEYVIWFGANIYQANFPMQTLSRKVAEASAEGTLKFVLVDVRAPNAAMRASRFVKVQPGGDAGIVMGMIRHIIENHRYNGAFLTAPSYDAAHTAGEMDYTNATWLVVEDAGHPLHGQFLTAAAAGLAAGKESADAPTVIDAATGKAALAAQTSVAKLWPSGDLSSAAITVNGVTCRTAFQVLYEEAQSRSYEEYQEIAGVPASTIKELAMEFTAHGRKAVADFYRGPAMHSNGVYTGRGIMTLNFLVGNIDHAGGYITGGKPADFMGSYSGAPYNLGKWPAPAYSVPPGVKISREGSFYENTSFYQDAVGKGQQPFPAPRPWFPFGFGIWHEIFAGAWFQYPYPVKILLQHEANPAWSAPPGMSGAPDESLPWFRLIKDLDKVPLFIASDILVSETSHYADYVVPDTGYLECWGMLPGFPTVPTSVVGVRQPVIEPLIARTPGGEPMCVEQFLIDVARKLGMPGFGKNAFMEGGDLNTREDFYLKMVANIAFYPAYLKKEGERLVPTGPVPDASAPDDWKDAKRWQQRYGNALKQAEWAKAAYVLARGGRFEDYDAGYLPAPLPEWMTYRYGDEKMPCQVYNATFAKTHNAITGETFSPVAKYEPLRFMDGTLLSTADPRKEYPFVLSTYKQPIHSKSRTWADKWLVELMPEAYVEMNPWDAKQLDVQNGDWVLVRSATYPKGLKGQVQIMPGIRPGVVSFPAAFGHWHYDSGEWRIDGNLYRGDKELNTRVRLNAVMRLDPSLSDHSGWGTCIEDPVGGGADYYSTRVRVEKTMPASRTLVQT
ncbi:molybdopterin dinucleotide binding domain-containing protein [Acidithiobacillus sulfuriphilus]|uniref:Molybdopterin dinucleotide-binding protein n=2 Tax=Acidithiobacillus sulfuriphilus TaxID=1867749 RepID=A0A3M8R507_9PROT|nr:molybdopterin dinucleotide binding domain-containing protein [Acidithiobacillus sulfuriphilus]RNF61620.1 molybdopterin dinucleotide-binding protein [Acidithiobacillus sulfuriphilus]